MKTIRYVSLCCILAWTGCASGDVQGRPWDESRQCWGPLQDAGFQWSASFGAGDAETYATSPEGEHWRFPTTTIPDDFVQVTDQSPESGFPQGREYCE